MDTSLIPKSDYLAGFKSTLAPKDILLTVAFCRSSSSSYPLAVSAARGAQEYREWEAEGKKVHAAVFGKNAEGAKGAILLLKHISQWKGCEIHAGGRALRSAWELFPILQCYLEALACADWKAHCLCTMDDPLREPPKYSGGVSIGLSFSLAEKKERPRPIIKEVEKYLFPCSKLLNNFRFRFQIGHPSSPADQIQAAAVAHNIDLCALFDPASFKNLGTRLVSLK